MYFLIVLEKDCFLKKVFCKVILIFFFKIDNVILDPDTDLDPDLNWAKILDPDPNSMYPVFGSSTLSGATHKIPVPIS